MPNGTKALYQIPTLICRFTCLYNAGGLMYISSQLIVSVDWGYKS